MLSDTKLLLALLYFLLVALETRVKFIVLLDIKSPSSHPLYFFKLYFIDYAITVVVIFPLGLPPPSTTHSLRQSSTIVHVHR